MAREVQVTIDCADPAGLTAFWVEALGYHVPGPPGGFAAPPFEHGHLLLADPEGNEFCLD